MRPGLRWLLGLSVLLSAIALWWPAEHGVVAAAPSSAEAAAAPAMEHRPPAQWVVNSPAQRAPDVTEKEGLLPARLPSPGFDPATFDPFAGVMAPQPVQPKQAPTPVVDALAPPPPPMAPALNYRYLGQMTDPAGQRWVYLAKDDVPLTITVGTRLEEGYVVEGIGAETIRLRYPPLDAQAVIAVPPARLP